MDRQETAETQLYASTMLRHTPAGIALFDAQDFRLLRANAYFQRILDANNDPHWQNGQTTGHQFFDWLPASTAHKFLSIFRHVATTGEPYRRGEHVFFNAPHIPSYWTWNLAALRAKNGHIAYLLLNASNVTRHVVARQKAEATHAALDSSNRLLEADRRRLTIVETVARSVRELLDIEHISKITIKNLVTHIEPRSVYIHTADAVERRMNLLHAFLINDDQQVVQSIQTVPYDGPTILSHMYKQRDLFIIENAQDKSVQENLTSYNPLSALGVHGYICAPLWYHDRFEGTLTTSFFHDIQRDGEEVQALAGCVPHISAALAHARLHTEVVNERERLRITLDQLPEGVLIVAASDRTIKYANQVTAHLMGRSLDNLLGSPFNTNTDNQPLPHTRGQKQHATSWVHLIELALQGEIMSSEESIIEQPDGSNVTCLSSCAPLRAEHGAIDGAMIVFQDITRLKSTEQQKAEFLSIASHELRTPITAMLGFAEILQMRVKQGASLDDVSQRALRHITEQSEQLTRLIEEMLDVTRIENAGLHLNSAYHNLVETLSNVIESQSITSKKHSIIFLKKDLQQPDILIAYYDEKRLIQIMSNLLSNSIKYSPQKSKIEVGLQHIHEQPEIALIWVKDQGIGIPPAELAHIFERFYRADNMDRSISGLGLGLYLVKELVTLHGGHIRVESQEGQGSTFYVVLPLDKKVE
ncbi:MAG TPA: ATP-binding protein [Ktedonobacteraceae bacterium]|nr:ATP-binding protein [Ktedonobacteraceae bacterium]